MCMDASFGLHASVFLGHFDFDKLIVKVQDTRADA